MPEVPLLELKNLTIIRAGAKVLEPLVQNLSLCLERGQSLGLVGESGSGKSLTALASMRLLPEPELRLQSGSVQFQGQDLASLSTTEMNNLRGSRISIIFQDALAALNPVRRIQVQMEEIFRFHRTPHIKSERRDQIHAALSQAGLPETERVLRAYPHELSGGMRQRVLLAMALLLKPDLLIADEPTTALDVTLQARWVEQVRRLQHEQKLALLFISHDLALVAELCEHIAVLYRGQLVEQAPTAVLMERPRHPYTQAMMRAMLRTGQHPDYVKPDVREHSSLKGCAYAAHCPRVKALCHDKKPELSGSGHHRVACHAEKGE